MTRRRGRGFAVGVLALVFTGCAPKISAPAPSPSAEASATPRSSPPAIPIAVNASRVGNKYMSLTEYRANRKLYVLRADLEKGHYFGSDTGTSTFVNPHVTFFGRDGKRLVADAPTGTAVERDKTVRMILGHSATDSNSMYGDHELGQMLREIEKLPAYQGYGLPSFEPAE